MASPKRETWIDLAADTSWTPSHVSEGELFPEPLVGHLGVAASAWESWKVPAAPGFGAHLTAIAPLPIEPFSIAHAHAPSGHEAARVQARLLRFSRAGGQRRLALFGLLDEVQRAHGQRLAARTSVSVAAPAFCEAAAPADRSAAPALAPSSVDAGTWARHALEGGPWGVAALRHLFDDALLGRSATEAAVMQTFTAQIGFANLEFFAAAARSSGDLDDDLATAIAAAEAAEVRQAQQGAATLRVLVENGRAAEAQQLVDVAFWRAWRVLCLTTGQAMDYHVPLAHRTRSFKELVVATIVEPFARALTGLGLETPWYWDQFRRSVDSYQHGMHLGIWCWRPHGGFPARPGVAADERQWLEEKYPGWNDSFGRCWDAIAENTRLGKLDRGRAASVPVVCSLCCIPIVGVPGAGWSGAAGTRAYGLTHEGRCYSFCSEACRWIFRLDPKRYAGHLGFIDRTVRRLTTAGAGQAASFLDRRSNDSQPQG